MAHCCVIGSVAPSPYLRGGDAVVDCLGGM